MSNLLQSSFEIGKKGIRLEAMLEKEITLVHHYKGCEPWVANALVNIEYFTCHKCGKKHPVLYTFWRKVRDTFGHFLVFRINGKDSIPDISVPISLNKMPRDAKRMSEAEASIVWHRI